MYHVSLTSLFKTGWNGQRYLSETKSSISPASSRQLNIVPDGIDKLTSVSSIAVELLSHHSIIVLGKDCVLIVRKENPPSFFFKESCFLTYSMIINKEGKALLSTYIIVSKQWISGLVYWTPDVGLNGKYSITGGMGAWGSADTCRSSTEESSCPGKPSEDGMFSPFSNTVLSFSFYLSFTSWYKETPSLVRINKCFLL